MNIWNKVLIGLICLVAVLATFWSAKVQSHYTKRGAEIVKLEKETAAAVKSSEEMTAYPEDSGKGVSVMQIRTIPVLEVRNAALLSDRAENWRDCTPKSVDQLQDKRVKIVFSVKQESTAATMNVGDTVYVFDQRPFDKGGKYLGRFAVSQVQNLDVVAESLDVLTDLELQNLNTSQRDSQSPQNAQEDSEQGAGQQAAWSVFSRCPTDRYDLFEVLADADKEKYLPESIRDLYSKAPENFEAIDFGTFFAYHYQKRIENTAQLAEKILQQSEIDESNRLASEALTSCQNENEQLKKEIEQMKAQRKEVEELCKALDAFCVQKKNEIQEIQRKNERLIEDIRKFQREMLQKSGRTAAEPASTASR
ncbi:MAG: hypothetical protein FWC43_07750 [Planctomycetaceae bacterium]|nr:hypothetical protein [Planctomycetaceae bacterium]MCL2305220.1 hypothetical protein [Planctomycetaceae bacterium]